MEELKAYAAIRPPPPMLLGASIGTLDAIGETGDVGVWDPSYASDLSRRGFVELWSGVWWVTAKGERILKVLRPKSKPSYRLSQLPKESRTMPMPKKPRSAAQKAATRKMLAANKKKQGKKKSKKKTAKKRKGKKKAARKSVTYCLVSPVSLKVLSCHKSRRLALETIAKKRTKYVPLILTRNELAKLKENRPKKRRTKKTARRRGRWNP